MKTHEEFAALLDAFVDGELSPEEAGTVQEHLNTCPDCQAYVDDLLAIRAAFPTVEETEVPAGFTEGVMAAIRAQSASAAAPKRSRQPWVRVLLPVAACFALVLVLKTTRPAMFADSEEAPQVYAGNTADLRSTAPDNTAPEPSDDAANIAPAQVEEPAPAQVEENVPTQMEKNAPAEAESPMSEPYAVKKSFPDEKNTVRESVCFAQILLTEEEAGTLLDGCTPIREADSETTYELTIPEYQVLLEGLEDAGIQPRFSMKNEGSTIPDHAVAVVVVQH